jgi:Spy/CpxP family protein refolding chaperone
MKTLSRFRLKPIQTVTFACALLFSASTLVQGQPNPDRPEQPGGEGRRMQRPQQGPQPGGPGGFRGGQGGQGLPMLEQVLTEDQRESIRQTMEAQREKMRSLQEKMRDARKALMTAAFAEDYKEKVVHAKALEVAKLEADMTVLRLKAVAEVQPALSKEQLEKIMNPQPPQGMGPSGDGQRPNRRGNRPPDGPRDGDAAQRPPKHEPQ